MRYSDTFVSIVMPVHNSSGYIRETLRSVASLRYPSDLCELIVVDDASIDDSLSIVAEQSKSIPFPTKIVRLSSSKGPSAARNLGWRSAIGAWIQFLDSDDLIHPDKLAKQIGFSEVSSTCAVLYSAWSRFFDGSKNAVEGMRIPNLENCQLEDFLRSENFLATGCHLMRRTALESIGGWAEDRRWIEDVDLHLRLAMSGFSFREVPYGEPSFLYRDHEKSLSKASRIGFADGCVRNARLVYDHRIASGHCTLAIRPILAWCYFMLGREYLLTDTQKALENWKLAFSIDPDFNPSQSKMYHLIRRICGLRVAEILSLARSRSRLQSSRFWGKS